MPIRGVKPGETRDDIFRETIVWDIVPERAALLVIDMQRCFSEEDGLFFVPEAKEKIPIINSVVDECRDRGIQIVWVVRHPYRNDGHDIGQEKDFIPWMVGNPAGYNEGGWGVELDEQMHKKDEDLVVAKTRYSAFISGSSNLDRIPAIPRDRHSHHRWRGHQCVLRDHRPGRNDAGLQGDLRSGC